MSGRHPDLVEQLCRELDALASSEEKKAAVLAALVPYWLPVPAKVSTHRRAAEMLRAAARRMEEEARVCQTAV